MKIDREQIEACNKPLLQRHRDEFRALRDRLQQRQIDTGDLISRAADFQVAIPSWALGAGGTRFGRFPIGGEPGSLAQKIDDVGLLHTLNRSSGAISLHIPWDIPGDMEAVRQQADSLGLRFDAVNSNTFQDQPGQEHSYKHGSLAHNRPEVRRQAVDHNIEVIRYGEQLGSKALTVWLADGTSFPGQQDFRKAFHNTLDSLRKIYAELPEEWKLLVEYKPYEPNFYSMVIPDWGTSMLLANKLGDKAFSLVDLGHHLPNANIEQIVSLLQMEGKLGGFHFNDSKYGDDDLTVGSVKPYQLFLIFNQLVRGMEESRSPELSWMIDASHNVKDPLEDLLQSVEAILLAYLRALAVDRAGLRRAQEANDTVMAQESLQEAFRTDFRPVLREARLRNGAALDPLSAYRELEVRAALIGERGSDTIATGL